MIVLLVLLVALTAWPAQAQAPESILTEIGIDQKLDAQLPLDLVFKDESGKQVRLGEFFKDKPVVLSLAYYECPMLCSMVLNGLLRSLRALPLGVGPDFNVLTISFDPAEAPALAATKKTVYAKQYGRSGAEDGWHFLTGEEEAIRKLTDSIGYRFKYDTYTRQWAHVAAVMVLTPEGRMSQYLYGIEYSARDLRLSLVQASHHNIGTVVDRVLLYCYHYDPTLGKFGFAIMSVLRIAGCGTVVALGAFIFLGWRRDRRVSQRGC